MWAIDLYRFELIEQLRYQPAADPGTERKHNRQIMAVLTGEHFLQSAPDAEPVLLYSHATSDSGHAADAGTNDATSEQRPLEQDLETSASEQGEETWSPMPSDAEVVKRSQRILEAAAFFAREAQRQRLLPDRITVCHRDTTLRRWTRRWWLRAGKPRPRPLRRRAGWQIRPYRGQGSVETPTDLSISSVTITTSGRVLFDAEWPHDIREMGTRADRSTNPPVFPIDPYENWEQLVEDILDTLRRVLKSVHGSLPVALDGDIERSRANLLKPLSTAESGASDA